MVMHARPDFNRFPATVISFRIAENGTEHDPNMTWRVAQTDLEVMTARLS